MKPRGNGSHVVWLSCKQTPLGHAVVADMANTGIHIMLNSVYLLSLCSNLICCYGVLTLTVHAFGLCYIEALQLFFFLNLIITSRPQPCGASSLWGF